jgi:NDP-sugar pyrophosphorylase family protein
VRAVVLVGGEGTRLRPLTTTVPKPLLPIAGQPFLERQLSWLARHGVTEAVLSLGYLPDAFRAHFVHDDFEGMQLHYAVEPYPLGTAGGIRFAADAAGIDDRFVVCNGDVLTTLDVDALVHLHADREAEATIHLTQVGDPSAFGVVPTRDDGSVIAFVEKPPPGTAPSDWINAGTYVLEPTVLERIPPDLTVSIERETFPKMLDDQAGLFASGTDDYWLDIGTPDKYLQAHTDTIGGRLGLPPVAGAEELTPGVWMRSDVTVTANATVRAPALLGRKTVIDAGARVDTASVGSGVFVGRDAVVRHAVLLDGARVGARASVEGSIVGIDAVIGDGASVHDCSVVGPGVHVAAGSTVAAARVDAPSAVR